MAKINIPYVLKESQLVAKWLDKFYPAAMRWKNKRLGPLPDLEMAKMYSVTQRYADAIFFKDGVINIVEGKVHADPSAVGQLEMYRDLLRTTPSFTELKDQPIKLWLLACVPDLATMEFCSKKDINYEIWIPDGYEYDANTRQVVLKPKKE